MIRRIFSQRIDWQGITHKVTYEPNRLGRNDNLTAHLQISTVAPKGAILPVTETGYRSRFLPHEVIEAEGGPVAYVRAWLDAADTPQWRAQQEAARQLCLF